MNQLIKGKWYQSSRSQCYYKHDFSEDECNYYSESINESNVHRFINDYNTLNNNEIKLINISKIIHLLPKNHKDLKCKKYELW